MQKNKPKQKIGKMEAAKQQTTITTILGVFL
jgi:hypothetical protein